MSRLHISDFPLELLKHIAGELADIHDIIRFSLVSQTFYDAVNSDQSVYRALFLHTYEPPRNALGYDWKTSFRQRYAKIPEEAILHEMVLEARPRRAHPLSVATSPNIRALSWILANTNPTFSSNLGVLLLPVRFLPKGEKDNNRRTIPNMQPHWVVNLGSSPGGTILFQLGAEILVRYSQEMDKISRAFLEQLALLIHPGFHVFGQRTRVKLQPYEMPNFWEGDGQESTLPRRWFGGYLHIPVGMWTQRLVLIDMRLTFSEDGRFTSQGFDVGQFWITQGTIGEKDANGRRAISWIKDYGGYQWRFKGVLEYGQQIMVGVWGMPGPEDTVLSHSGYGIFMYWAVPDEAPALSPRTPQAEEN